MAVLVDRLTGEPPALCHPVVWMGKLLSFCGAPWAGRSSRAQLSNGGFCWIAGAALTSGAAALVVLGIQWAGAAAGPHWAVALEILLTGVLLKPLLAWRMLRTEVAAVERAVGLNLEAGRRQLSRLVSRDTRSLDETQIRESALESLAENLNDSLVAPLFWFAVAGLPGAALYRFANTADAMWGYRGSWEWAGKCSARADDVLSYMPARLTAVLLSLASGRSLTGLATVAAATPSPNSGWPMGMLAIALEVRLSKPGVYALNAEGSSAESAHTRRALRICERAVWFAVFATAVVAAAVEVGAGLSW